MSSVDRNELELRNFCVMKISGSKTDPGQLCEGLKKDSGWEGREGVREKFQCPKDLGGTHVADGVQGEGRCSGPHKGQTWAFSTPQSKTAALSPHFLPTLLSHSEVMFVSHLSLPQTGPLPCLT